MSLHAVPPELLLGVAVVAVVVLVAKVLAGALTRAARRRRIHVRAARAGDGERRAAAWLERDGFVVEGAQARVTYEVTVDGKAVEVPLRADYLVAREGLRYVAEVKTGELAPRIDTPATRRQLLEYLVAFDVDGVLLVDAERGAVREVRFPDRGAPASTANDRARGLSSALAWLVVGLAAGVPFGAVAARAFTAPNGPADQAAARTSAAGSTRFSIPESTHFRASSSATGLASATRP